MSSDLSLQYDIFVFSSITNLLLVKKTNLFFFATDFTVYDGYLFLGNLFSTDLLTQKTNLFFSKTNLFSSKQIKKTNRSFRTFLIDRDLQNQKQICVFWKQICFHINKLREQIGRFRDYGHSESTDLFRPICFWNHRFVITDLFSKFTDLFCQFAEN